MLRWRLLLGTIFIAAVVGLCWLDYHAARPGVWLLPLAIALAVLAAGEMVGLTSTREVKPIAWVVYLGTLLIVAMSGVPLLFPIPPNCPVGPLGWPLLGVAAGVGLAFVGEMRRYERPGRVLEGIALAVFSMVYVGVLLAFAVQLRRFGAGGTGLLALASLIIVVKMTDIGAYTVGRLVGRHKMAPVISPGKTWEGLAGGLAFACAASWATFAVLIPAMELPVSSAARPYWGWLAFGVLVGAAGTLGDLGESLLKRDAGCKDSSRWMPGFGGVLDILDSILSGAPVAYLCWVLGWVGV